MRRRILVADAFTSRRFDGNPAGVVPDAEGMTEAEMQLVAREVNASETAFVFPSETADFRLRFFTPACEVPFCGHAFLASAAALADEGRIAVEGEFARLTLETATGRHPADLRRGKGLWHAEMTQPPALFRPVHHPADAVSACLGVEPSELDPSLPLETASTGLWHLMVPLRDPASVARMRPRMGALGDLNREMGALGTHVFAPAGAWWRTRDFCPLAGVDEDPVTGSASGAMGAYLVRHGRAMPGDRLSLEQRRADGRGGLVSVAVEGTRQAPGPVRVGGSVVVSLRGELEFGDG